MSRIRSLKPEFFKDEKLAELPFEGRLLFQGLWLLADREGRLEYRPKFIKAEVFPYDSVEIEKLLDSLERLDFIFSYQVDGKRYLQIKNFAKHQRPNSREPDSTLPIPLPIV